MSFGAIPPGLMAAFAELGGGCKHTPEPWKACDTCGRPVAEWTKRAGLQITDVTWRAQILDGAVFDKRDVLSIDNIPAQKREQLHTLRVMTDSPATPFVTAVVDPRKAQHIHMFKRHGQKMKISSGEGGAEAATVGGKLTVFVVQITPDKSKPDEFIRLYIHPLAGLILSTQDIRFD